MNNDPFIGPLHGHRGERHKKTGAPAGLTIAMSREAGARGGSIARHVGRRLGWQVYTQELLEFLCGNDAARQSILSDVPADAADWVSEEMARLVREKLVDSNAENEMQTLLLTLASRGQIVLVGRGAGYYLPRESTLHVRIIAPLKDRIGHMADWLRLPYDQAAEQVRKRDESRAEYMSKHFGKHLVEPHDFDLILNSGLIGEETATEVIVSALLGKQAFVSQTPSTV
jgi:cytidylate kinase